MMNKGVFFEKFEGNAIIPKLLRIYLFIWRQFLTHKETFFLKKIYSKYINNNKRVDIIKKMSMIGSLQEQFDERGLPCEEFFPDGWWKKMLLRYGIAMHFSKNKDVLETCCGIGWGAYLLDEVARTVTCVELKKEAIYSAKQLWVTDKTSYVNDNVLDCPFKNETFDVITAMESIEHFVISDIKKYLSELYRLLKTGGLLIGSSYFPETREEADQVCLNNDFHLYICTQKEIRYLLDKIGFKKIKIYQNNFLFSAVK